MSVVLPNSDNPGTDTQVTATLPQMPQTQAPDLGSASILAGGTIPMSLLTPSGRPIPQAPSVAAGRPNPFAGLLWGALQGMGAAAGNERSFWGGMGRAIAANREQQQQEQQNDIQDQTLKLAQQRQQIDQQKSEAQSDLDHANAAKSWADMLHTEALTMKLPQDQQNAMAESFGKAMEAWKNAGYQGTEIDDTWQARNAYMQQMQADGVKPGEVIFAPDPQRGKILALKYDPSKLVKADDVVAVGKALDLDLPHIDLDGQTFNALIASGAREQAEKWSSDAAMQRTKVEGDYRMAAARLAQQGNASPDDVKTIGDAVATGRMTLDQIPNFSKVKPAIEAYIARNYPAANITDMNLTTQDRNRMTLANNASHNLDLIADIIQQRPDLVGKAAGRVSDLMENKVGTDDPDLSSLATALDNYAKAATGAHNLRSKQALQDTKTSLLGSFKNGPGAIMASIQTAKSSLYTLAHAPQMNTQNANVPSPDQQTPQYSPDNPFAPKVK